MAEGEVAKVHVYLGLRSDLAKDMAGEIRKFDRETRNLSKVNDALLQAGKVMTIGVTVPIALAANQMKNLAMNAIETENLYTVSVGSMKASFDKFVNDTSKALGINRYELQKTAGTLNVMLGSMGFTENQAYKMSTAFSQLTYDMASFYNLPVEEAFQKLQSGLAGEVEPLRRLGIMVDETTVKTYAYANGIAQQGKELTANEKVLARYGVIMQATAKAQGDLARTADSPANAARRLSQTLQQAGADLGKVFIPAVSAGTTVVADLVSAFANSPAALKGFVVGATGVIAISGPTILAITGIRRAIVDLARTAPMLSAAMPWIGIASLVVGAAVAIGTAVKEHNEQLERNKQLTNDLTAQLRSVRSQLDDTALSQETRNELLDQEKTLLEQLSETLPETIGERDAEGKLIAISTEQLDAYNQKLREEETAHNNATIAINNQRKAELELQRAQALRIAQENARMNAAPISAEDLTIIQSYDDQIKALSDDTATLTKRNEDLANGLAGDGKTKPPPVASGLGKTVTALDRLRRELEITRAENELFRAEMGLDSATNEQIAKEYDAQAKIVEELTRQYNALAKAKGLAADATRDTYLELQKERTVLAEIKAQLEAERKAQMEYTGTPEQAANRDAFVKGMITNFSDLVKAYQDRYGITQFDAEQGALRYGLQEIQSGRITQPGNVTINIYPSDQSEAMRGTTRALEQAGILNG